MYYTYICIRTSQTALVQQYSVHLLLFPCALIQLINPDCLGLALMISNDIRREGRGRGGGGGGGGLGGGERGGIYICIFRGLSLVCVSN